MQMEALRAVQKAKDAELSKLKHDTNSSLSGEPQLSNSVGESTSIRQ